MSFEEISNRMPLLVQRFLYCAKVTMFGDFVLVNIVLPTLP